GEVPSLIVRRANTTIELRDGQSFVIGGLLLNSTRSTQEQVPWLGDLPVLGQLFASRCYQKKENDLAINVHPRVVRAARTCDTVKTPLDNTLPANDQDFFLYGKGEIPRAARRDSTGATVPLSGHMLDLPKGGLHVVSAKN